MPNPIKIKSYVDSLIDHGDHVYTVFIRPEGRFPRFKPGQFLHLTVDDFDPASGFWPESRVFSIASRPGAETIRIIYSVKGKYTAKMESYLKPGSMVWLKFPYGDFIIESKPETKRDLVLIAGGTGITPFIPFLESLSENRDSDREIILHYGVRKAKLILVDDLLERCLHQVSGFRLQFTVENEEEGFPDFSNTNIKKGFIDIEDILSESRGLNDPLYYISGPPTMIRSFKAYLTTQSIPSDAIKTDEWE